MPGKIPYFLPENGRQAGVEYERLQSRLADKRFYASMRWLELRLSKLRTDPLCQACLMKGEVTPAQQVHHRVDRKDNPDLAYDWDNLESVCIPCHNAKRALPR